jgi:hypothetical protein
VAEEVAVPRLLPLSLLLVALVGSPARAADEPRELIEKAIAAQGGAEKLGREAAVGMKLKITLHEPVEGLSFSGTITTQGPTRYKMALDVDIGGNRMTVTAVRDGKTGWKMMNGMPAEDMPAEEIQQMDQMMHGDRVAQLLPLLKDKGFTLESLGEEKVEGESALGVKVKAEGKPDVSLYFDKKTHLLVKMATRAKHFATGQDALHETVMSDYREATSVAGDEAVLKAAGVATDGPALVAYLKDRQPKQADDERVKALIKQLGADDFATRDRATKELAELGAAAVPRLREALKNPDPEVSLRAVALLEKIGNRSGAEAVNAAVRLVAVKKPDGAAAVLLDVATRAADEQTAREARAALLAVAVRDGKPDRVLTEALDDKDPARKAAAEAALGKDGGKAAKEAGLRVYMDGVKLPMKATLYLDGKKAMVKEVSDVEFFNRLDDSFFAKPK